MIGEVFHGSSEVASLGRRPGFEAKAQTSGKELGKVVGRERGGGEQRGEWGVGQRSTLHITGN